MTEKIDYAKIIKSRISLVDYLGKDLKIIKSGANYKALCPFHEEKTPSFVINDEKNSYNCFGCGKSGDIFSYVMEKYKLDFKESLKILANEIGIDIKNNNNYGPRKSIENQKKFFKIMEIITNYYHENLKENYEKNKYISEFLKEKEIDIDIIKRFKLGYSLDAYHVIEYLKKYSVNSDTLLELGIYKKNLNGKIFDSFSKRLIFPIIERLNKTIGFGGRILKGDGPKYINSSENEFFKKRYTLYNMNSLKNLKSKFQKLFFVEGYTDVISMEKEGYNAIAPLGTAVSIEQLILSWKYSNEPIILFDGDEAGRKATLRVLDLALPLIEAEKLLSFIFLENNDDPDTLLKQGNGKKKMNSLIKNKLSFIETLIKSEVVDNLDTPERVLLFKNNILKKIQKIKNDEIRSLYKFIVSEKIKKSLRISITNSNYNPISHNKDKQFIKNFKDRKDEQFVLRRERSILGAMINNFNLLRENDEIFAEIYISNGELSFLRDKIIEIISNKDISKSEDLKNILIDKGMSKIIKNHFATEDCIKFNLVENYANEKTNINDAKKALMDVILLQEKWYKRKNKNLSNIT